MAQDQAKSSSQSGQPKADTGADVRADDKVANAKKGRKENAKAQSPAGTSTSPALPPLPGASATTGTPPAKEQPSLAAMSSSPLPFPRIEPGAAANSSTSGMAPPPLPAAAALPGKSSSAVQPGPKARDRNVSSTATTPPSLGIEPAAEMSKPKPSATVIGAPPARSSNVPSPPQSPGSLAGALATVLPPTPPQAAKAQAGAQKAAAPQPATAQHAATAAAPLSKPGFASPAMEPENEFADTELDEQPEQPPFANDQDGSAIERRVARRRPAGPVRGKVAANDDAPSIGGLIYALEQKPSGRIFQHAAIASAAWAVIALFFAIYSLSSEAALSSWGAILAKPTTFLTAAAVIVPIAVIWFLALLGWRAEELRLRSSTMTEVAIRLAEPDRMAEDSIASLGQAVRRQVGFMNEAVGRALGRAGELEALVHNEVAALERSYEENERRIRGLINELANERHALNSTSTSFNETLRTLGREVPVLIEKLSNQQTNLSSIIHGAGDNLYQLESSIAKSVTALQTELGGRTGELKGVLENYTGALGQALGTRTEQLEAMLGTHGQRLQTMIDDRSGRLGDALGGRTQEMQKMLEGYTGALATALSSRTTHMQKAFAEHMGKLDAAIANRTTNLQTVFEEYARALDTTLASRAGTLDKQLIERTRALDSAFENRLQLFDQAIQASTRAIDNAVDTRAKALTGALENHAKTFSETIQRQSADLDHSLNQGINAVRRTSENITRHSLNAIENLAGQSDMLKSVSENLVAQIGSLTNRFEAQGQTILKAANALESVNYKIDSTLQTRHAELSETLDRMVGKANEFTRHVKDYSTTIEGTLSEAEKRALAAAEQLQIGAQSHRDQALSQIERLKSDTEAESSRALADLKSRLSHVSDEVTSQLASLGDRFSETSEDVRRRAERVAEELAREQNRMREEAERLPHTTRESAEAMRRALQDQLRAIDQLSNMTNREAHRRDVTLPIAQGGALKPASSQTNPRQGLSGPGTPPAGTQDRPLSSLSETLAQELGARTGHRPMTGDGNDPHSNWSMGDLLKRASGDEAANAQAQHGQRAHIPQQQPPAPVHTNAAPPRQHQPFKLDIDALAHAIDGATAAVIWTRLRSGQRGIMVRSIYAPEGRQVFDEVARRYPTDAHLQTTIDRYVTDFERILRDAEAKDASGRLAQSHMSSTMGRVYLLLAHASGRIT